MGGSKLITYFIVGFIPWPHRFGPAQRAGGGGQGCNCPGYPDVAPTIQPAPTRIAGKD